MRFIKIKMSQHFNWYPASQTVVPWNARYAFPTQANKTSIVTPRIPPKNAGNFSPGNTIRVEFPAQGYINPARTFLEFDVCLGCSSTAATDVWTRFQNNISSIFSRGRIMYGSTPLEDIPNYNMIVRSLTEWTSTAGNTHDQTSISEGIGGSVASNYFFGSGSTVTPESGFRNVRQSLIQGIDLTQGLSFSPGLGFVPNKVRSDTSVGAYGCTRRYQIQFAFGLFNQDKLIPAKYMASQFAIELTLADAQACIITFSNSASTPDISPTYRVLNVNLIPEILEFDPSYDASILRGLREGGIPIKFSSWHYYQFNAGGSSQLNLQIQERSRSVKGMFTVIRRAPASIEMDSGATLFMPVLDQTLQNYQYRIGGRYYPAAPVECALAPSSSTSNGGAEAFCELQKFLNIVGDYRLSSAVNSIRWGQPISSAIVTSSSNVLSLSANAYSDQAELDYKRIIVGYTDSGTALVNMKTQKTNGYEGTVGSQCFAMGVNLEASNGMEISGLNAEEQSDISFMARYSAALPLGFVAETYVYYDAMIVLEENNLVTLIE